MRTAHNQTQSARSRHRRLFRLFHCIEGHQLPPSTVLPVMSTFHYAISLDSSREKIINKKMKRRVPVRANCVAFCSQFSKPIKSALKSTFFVFFLERYLARGNPTCELLARVTRFHRSDLMIFSLLHCAIR